MNAGVCADEPSDVFCCAENVVLTSASAVESVNTPDPLTEILFTPAPANKVRVPSLSLLVISTASSLRVIDVDLRPPIVT